MRRREFLGALGGAAGLWPISARAQRSALPVVGLLRSSSSNEEPYVIASLSKGLSEAGFVVGSKCDH